MRFSLLMLLAILAGAPAATAQQFVLAGQWNCTVNARSTDPDGNYGLEVQTQLNPDGTLFAQGVVIYPNLRNSIQNVRGPGDWTWLPPEGSNGPLLKMRMFPNNHPIVAWFARPGGPGVMYNLWRHPSGRTQVETQCGKFR